MIAVIFVCKLTKQALAKRGGPYKPLRAIQHAQPESAENKNPSDRTDALERIRGKLKIINKKMAVQIGAFLKHHGPFKASMGDLLISHVGFEQLPGENKSELLDKLLAISAVTEQ